MAASGRIYCQTGGSRKANEQKVERDAKSRPMSGRRRLVSCTKCGSGASCRVLSGIRRADADRPCCSCCPPSRCATPVRRGCWCQPVGSDQAGWDGERCAGCSWARWMGGRRRGGGGRQMRVYVVDGFCACKSGSADDDDGLCCDIGGVYRRARRRCCAGGGNCVVPTRAIRP